MFRKDIGGWIAADATYSIYLPDGRTLWLFGDTFIGEVEEDNSIAPGVVMIRNSAVIQDGDSLRTLYGGTPAARMILFLQLIRIQPGTGQNTEWSLTIHSGSLWPDTV